MNPDHGQEEAAAPSQTPFFRRRSKLLLSSFLSLIVLVGAVFSVASVMAENHTSRAAASGLVGDVSTYQSKTQLAQGVHAVPPQQTQRHASALTGTLPAYNNVGISAKANLAAGNFDGGGYSYSYEALISTDIEPGLPFTYKNIPFTWTNVNNQNNPTQADNWQTSGQVLPISSKSTATLGFIGAASNGNATGTVTVTYSDSTTQTYTLSLSDWTLGGGKASPVSGNTIVSAQTTRNSRAGSQSIKTYLFYTSINTNTAKTVVSVTLPTVTTKAQLHIFAYGAGDTSYINPYPYNSVGMSNDAMPGSGNFDGAHNSYSSALMPWGVGYTLLYNQNLAGNYSMTFKWPDVLPGDADNYLAHGQMVPIGQVANATKVGFVGAATGGPSVGMGSLYYSDGSSQDFQLGFSDWTLNGYTQPPAYNNRLFASMTARNTPNGQQSVRTFLFYTEIAVDPSKTVVNVTLPSSVNKGQIHVYAIAAGQTGFFDNVGVSDDNGPVFGNLDGANHSYSGQALENAGIKFSTASSIQPFTINGTSFNVKYSGGVSPDNWISNGQVISASDISTVPSATTLAFLGSAVNGSPSGQGTIYYSDNSTQVFTLGLTDWCATTPAYGNYVAVTMPYRNTPTGKQTVKNSLYYAEVPIDPSKAVASIQLPVTNGGTMHIFAVGERTGNLNNIGITNSGATSIGAFDHYHGSSYSAQALQSKGLVSGQNFSSNGYSFPWPAAGTLDNYMAAGQTLPVTAPANASGLAFLGSATNGGASGDVTITYTDGSTQTDSLAFLDWCNSTRSTINWNPIIAATMPYRNTQGGQQTINNYIYFSEFKLDSTKTVQSITLPQSGSLHIFSYAFK